MVNYNIREPVDKEIIRCINVLYSAFGRSLPPNIKKEERVWKALIDSEIGRFLISEENGRFFGIGGVFLFEKVSSFGYMAVLPKYRGRGVGTEIFRNLMKIADERNSETMVLYASALGKPIYEKFGFQERFYGSMYKLPVQSLKLIKTPKKVKILNMIPDWGLTLDHQTMGFDRTNYLNLRTKLGAKVLMIEYEGYGLLDNKRLGPLIAVNEDVAQQIINKSIKLGADHLIIAEHQYLSKNFIKKGMLTKMENNGSIKMVSGKGVLEKLHFLYAIGTFAKG